MPKHLCLVCGAFIKWSLALCFDCNVRLRESGGTTVTSTGKHLYPTYQQFQEDNN